jgi:putative oxidoreductase
MQTTTLAPERFALAPATAEITKRILTTEPRWTLLVLRLTLGLMILPHGAQKLLGWFGGYGFAGTMGYFTDTLGIPYAFGLLAIIAEFFGGLALLAGLFTRPAALGVGATMLVAMLTVHARFGFFMNWSGSQQGEGIEFFLLAIGIAVALVIGGGGRYAADRALTTHS